MASTEYYDNTGYPAFGSLGSSAPMRAEFVKIEVGFSKMPDLAGNALKIVQVNAAGTAMQTAATIGSGSNVVLANGTVGSGNNVVVANSVTGSGSTAVFATDPTFSLTDTTTNNASTSQHGWMQKYPGGTTIFLNGAGNFTSIPGASLVLLATITPTASATASALNAFNSSYDSYLVIGEGIAPAADAILAARLAVGGALVASNYSASAAFSTAASTYASTSMGVSANVYTSGAINFRIFVHNVNDAVRIKGVDIASGFDTSSTQFAQFQSGHGFNSANVATGIGFLWLGGTNFKAQGTIRIYGIQKV